MIKRILSMLCILALLCAVLPCVAEGWSYDKHDEADDPADSDTTGSMYVYTANGKTLYMRKSPKSGAEVLRNIPWGAKVTVISNNGSWACVNYNGTEGYVVRKYLVSKRPSKDSKASSSASSTTGSTSGKTSSGKIDTKKETSVLTVKAVKPEDLMELDNAAEASVEPTLPAEEALMYQKPDQKAKVIARYESGYEVFIRAMSEDWARVYDPETEKEGYMLLEELVMDYVDEEEVEEDILEDEMSEDEEAEEADEEAI